MSELIQEEKIQESKYITVQEFLPQWSDLVERFINPTYSQQLEKGLDIWNPKYCLVSEAWDFNRKFGTEKSSMQITLKELSDKE